MERKNILPDEGSSICPPGILTIFIITKQTEENELVTRHGLLKGRILRMKVTSRRAGLKVNGPSIAKLGANIVKLMGALHLQLGHLLDHQPPHPSKAHCVYVL